MWEEVLQYENYDLDSIIMPIDVEKFNDILREVNYLNEKRRYLINGFTNGFDIGYQGPLDRRSYSENIPLRIGTPTQLWNQLMKEVELKRVAGPYNSIPFESFMQSPIGLVPKAGNKTRLIFQLVVQFWSE